MDVLFILMGSILVLFMHSGFAFLEAGTVRYKNQVNALSKIFSDLAVSTIVYFFIGYGIAYDVFWGFSSTDFLTQAIGQNQGYELVKFFFLMTFAAAVPAIISGGIAERAKFYPQLFATALIVGFVYPFFEGIVWNNNYGFQDSLTKWFDYPFHDFAGSVVVHGIGGWIALVAVVLLGVRIGRYKGSTVAFHPFKYSAIGIRFVDFNGWLVWF